MGAAPDRAFAPEATLFDSVGFALEDFSVLRYLDRHLGNMYVQTIDLIAQPLNPKDLYGAVI